MRRRTRLALAAIALIALGFAASVSTTSYTGVTAERGVSVAVADDEPYVGVTACAGSSNGTVHVHVTNRLDDDLTLRSVRAAVSRTDAASRPTISPGGARWVTVRFAATVDSVQLRLTAPGFEIELSRSVHPDGACPAG